LPKTGNEGKQKTKSEQAEIIFEKQVHLEFWGQSRIIGMLDNMNGKF
jgi:hypothetical protein